MNTLPPFTPNSFLPTPARVGKLDLSKFPGCVGPSRPIEPPTIYQPGDVREDGKVFSHYREHNLYWPVFITKEQLEKRQARQKEAYYNNHEANKAAARERYRKKAAKARRLLESIPTP